MELKDFVKETLLQIVQGISEAQEELKDTDCAINPREIEGGDQYAAIKNKKHMVQEVDFQVALTVTETSENKAGVGVMFGAFGVGGNSTSNDGNVSQTNVSFSIPVVFPSVDNQNKPTSSYTGISLPRNRR